MAGRPLDVPVPVAIALGSNLGDRREHLRRAIESLGRRIAHVRASSIIETDPVDVGEAQPPYLNAVVVGETTLPPVDLLNWLMQLEREQGRERPAPRAPRTLDLDIVLYGDSIIDDAGLEVPHPRFRTRRFVLEPLAEVAPEWVDPVSEKTVGALLADLKTETAG